MAVWVSRLLSSFSEFMRIFSVLCTYLCMKDIKTAKETSLLFVFLSLNHFHNVKGVWLHCQGRQFCQNCFAFPLRRCLL